MQYLKNIEPIHAYAVRAAAEPSHTGRLGNAQAPLALPDKPSIAVLPFTNMSGDPEQDYFADGMVEDIITRYLVSRRCSLTHPKLASTCFTSTARPLYVKLELRR